MAVCPFANWKPVRGHGGVMSSHLGLVLHVQQGNNSLAGWFNNPQAGASSTWWVSKSGLLEQYVDANVSAWAQGSGNSTYNSVETEGYTTEALTPAAEAMLARLYQWGVQTYRWPLVLAEAPGQPGFGWHGMGGAAYGGHTGCPGDLRKNRRQAILTAAGGRPAPAPTPPSTTTKGGAVSLRRTSSGKGYWIIGSDGGVFTYGDAKFYGSLGDKTLAAPVVDMAPLPNDRGYWLVAKDGGVFSFGDAKFYGSLGDVKLAAPISGVESSPTGLGYWLLGEDGGIFTFGDAKFYGAATGAVK